MLSPVRRSLAALVALLLALLLGALVGTAPVVAAGDTGVAFGTIRFPQKDNPGIKVLWFTKDWSYLGTRTAAGGSYSLNLPAGSYHLQFVDQRPSYKTDKYAPTDISVTVRAGHGTQKNVAMKKGAFITGTVKTHGKTAKKARVVAANQNQSSFETTANNKGQFAVGGLPEGKYSLFTYDHRHLYVDKSTYAGKLQPGGSANVAINLTKKAGSLRVYMFTSANGVKKRVSGNPVVTAVSKATGQFWSAKVTGGNVVFQGLYPGKYKLVANGFGVWFGRTGAIEGANVRAGKADFGTFTYTKRGGWVSGTVVDGGSDDGSDFPMKDSVVRLFDAGGAELTSTTADENGHFTLSGQFGTMNGLTVTVDPNPSGGGWATAAPPDNYCQFVQGSTAPVSITLGQGTDVGAVPLPRSTASSQPTQCLPND
ncbi:MAG: hypothetical protein JWN91_1849 [Nocardioides sp.]|jgi:hypothetical protein|nr:hypothetical protein [Nocardioides sp.]